MRDIRTRLLTITLFSLMFASPFSPLAAAQSTRPIPTTTHVTQTALMQEFIVASSRLHTLLPSPSILTDPQKRTELAPKAIPILKQMLTLADQMSQIDPRSQAQSAQLRYPLLAMLSLLGDESAAATLKSVAHARNTTDALTAQTAILLADWWRAGNNEAAQAKVLDNAQALVKVAPSDDAVASLLKLISEQASTAPPVKQRADKIIANDLQNPAAKRIAQRIQPEKKIPDQIGKPIALHGATFDGTTLSTANWKGKVVLVHFWATWFPPCREDLPQMKKIYADYHEKGLEILGISCDRNLDELKGFLQRNKDMSWPQLFDRAANPTLQWHPLAKEHNVTSIPVMFLIDKSGILRSITARNDFDELIPKLLDEKTP